VEEVGNEGKVELVDEISNNYLSRQLDGNTLQRGPEDIKRFMCELRKVLRDVHDVIEDMVAEEDKAATRLMVSGTHAGKFRSIAPIGKVLEIAGTIIFRFSEGKIVES